MINFEAVENNQFSFNLQKQNDIFKKKFSDERMQVTRATRGQKIFFRPESSVLV
jgi:hypothetical protein